MRRVEILIVAILALATSRCSNQNGPGSKEHMIKILTSGIWTTESVDNDEDGDLTSEYADFAIAFENRPDARFEGDYYVSKGGRAFPEVFGQWKFSADLAKLILANGRVIEVTASESTLVLVFTAVPSAEEVEDLSGKFTFKLRKK